MPTREATGSRRLFRAGTAVALLLAGTAVLAVGGAGLLTDLLVGGGTSVASAQALAFGVAALIPPVIFIGATWTTTGNRRTRRMAVGGGIVAGGIVIASLFIGGGSQAPVAFETPLGTGLSLLYGLGIVLMLGAVLDGVTRSTSDRSQSRAAQGWQAKTSTRSRKPNRAGTVPADGGSEDSELAFPLDSDAAEERDDPDQ